MRHATRLAPGTTGGKKTANVVGVMARARGRLETKL